MIKKFKITEKGKFGISLISDDKDKKTLVLGINKNAYLMVKHDARKVGDVIEVDVEVGTSGNYWAQDRTNRVSKMVEAKEIIFKENRLNSLLSEGTV